jgi:hypothetical protein
MSDIKYTRADVDEAFFNLGRLAGRIPQDEGKRLYMLTQVISSFIAQVVEENEHLRNGDKFDMDGRC